MSNKKELIKPPIKWVGGKTQIIEKILEEFPKEINNYFEIFLGGGSVLLALLSCKNIKITGKIHAYDLNETLIHFYKNIQTNPREFIDYTVNLVKEFNKIEDIEVNRKPKTIEDAKTSKESFYYWIRSQYNNLIQKKKNSIVGSSYFLFLNKTCFRGLYRTGPNGFNVPFGHYKNPEIINKDHILVISSLIKNVIFKVSDFKSSIKDEYESDDFIYLDPPYAPENNKSFVSYNEDGFGIEQHKNLFKLCNELETNFLMSNSDVELVKDNFDKDVFEIETISCKRSINSKKPGSKSNELLIKNYFFV